MSDMPVMKVKLTPIRTDALKITQSIKKQISEWIDALRSGKFEQTTENLQTKEGFCCLGVACKVFVPINKLHMIDDMLFGALPKQQGASPLWLKRINDDFKIRIGNTLTGLNDSGILDPDSSFYGKSFSFDEIADMLQLVYIEGADTSVID